MKPNPRQQKLLDYVKDSLDKRGFPPTVSEMAKAVGVKSKNAVVKMLKKLEVLSFIERDGTARGIRLLNPDGERLNFSEFSAPLLGTVPAGSPIAAEEHVEEWINLPATLFRKRRDVFLLRVRGDSMRDAGILEGDLVIVKPTKEVRNKEIVVALLHDEATVKRYIEISGRRYLKAENPKYQNIYPSDEWTVAGKVVGVIRQME